VAESAAAAPATPSIAVQVGFDVSGTPQNIGSDYDALTWTNITSHVRPEPAVTFNRGRAAAGETAAAGQLQVTVLNDDGDFTPGDNGGTYGAIHPRMPIRVLGDAGGYDPEFYGDDYASREVLWVGFITDVEWLIDSGQPLVKFTASDIIATAARAKCGPWLDKRVKGASSTGLVAYWPLTDPAPNGLGNATSTVVPMLAGEQLKSGLPGGSPLTLAAWNDRDVSCNVPTGGLSPDGQPNIAFTPGLTGTGWTDYGKHFTTSLPITGEFAMSVWLRTEDTGGDSAWAFSLDYPLGVGAVRTPLLRAIYDGVSELTVRIKSTDSEVASMAPGQWVHLYADMDGTDCLTYIDGVLVGTDACTIATATYLLRLGVSTSTSEGGWYGQMAHVAMWNTSDPSRAAILADRGASLPTVAQRFTDLVYVTANPPGLTSWMDADSLADRTVSAQATDGKSLLVLAQEAADAERGSVIAARDGRLALLSQRGNAAAASAALTLSAESDILSIDGLFGIDDADMLNEATVTLQPSGRTFTATRSSDPGVESTTADLWSTDDALAQSLAAALANAPAGTPRAPSLTISMDWMAHAGKSGAALLLELGDTITITDLPAAAPSSTLTVQVRTITHTISRDQWLVYLDADPPLQLCVLDDTDLGVLDDTAILGV